MCFKWSEICIFRAVKPVYSGQRNLCIQARWKPVYSGQWILYIQASETCVFRPVKPVYSGHWNLCIQASETCVFCSMKPITVHVGGCWVMYLCMTDNWRCLRMLSVHLCLLQTSDVGLEEIFTSLSKGSNNRHSRKYCISSRLLSMFCVRGQLSQ